MRPLRGRVALVTGASRGLGRRVALELARRGADVAVAARDAAQLKAVAAEAETAGAQALAVSADITDADDRQGLLDEVRARFGRIDVLVNNVGTVRVVGFLDEDPERLYHTNLLGPLALTRLAMPGMVDRGEGHILTVASLAGAIGLPYLANYSASKAALVAWSLALRSELRGTGVSTTVVCPGFITDDGAYVPYQTPTPWYFNSTTTAVVARKAVQAIERDRPHVIVNGLPVRPVATLLQGAPRFTQALLSRLGVQSFTGGLADLQLPYSS